MSLRTMLAIAGLAIAVVVSLMAGVHWSSPLQVWHALWSPSPTDVDDWLIRTTRMTRTLVALTVGAGLGVAGGIMQTLTRNPLASPGLLGVNAGALLVVVCLATLGSGLPGWLASGGAFAGAALAALAVWAIAMRPAAPRGPLGRVLAGAAVSALVDAFSQALLVIDQQGLDTMLFWLAGSVAARPLTQVWPLMLVTLAVLLA